MNKKVIILIFTTIAIIVAGIIYSSYMNSTFSLKVSFDNSQVESVKIIKHTKKDGVISDDIFLENIESDKPVRIPNQSATDEEDDNSLFFTVDYTGNGDYASGSESIPNERSVTIEIKPDYSEEKYKTLLDENIDSIKQVLLEKYPKADEYSMDAGKMTEYGEYYCTKLIHKGTYSNDSDDLRVVFQQKEGKWQVVAEPSIILTQKNNPDVPFKILSIANNYDY